MTFNKWYETYVVSKCYAEQQPYEGQQVAFYAVEQLARADILTMFDNMSEETLRLAFYDHVCKCVEEHFYPSQSDEWNDNE